MDEWQARGEAWIRARNPAEEPGSQHRVDTNMIPTMSPSDPSGQDR